MSRRNGEEYGEVSKGPEGLMDIENGPERGEKWPIIMELEEVGIGVEVGVTEERRGRKAVRGGL